MKTFVSPLRRARCWLTTGLVAGSCAQMQANQLSSAAEPDAGVLPPWPVGGGAEGEVLYELVDRAALEKMVRELSDAVGKSKVAGVEALITIDDAVRPDLGAVFSDTLTAKMLAAGTYEVVDAGALGAVHGQGLNLGNALAPAPDPEAPAKSCDTPFVTVRAWMTSPVKTDLAQTAVKTAHKALIGNGSLAGVISRNKVAQTFAEAGVDRHLQRLRQISFVDFKWCFCEFSCPPETLSVKDRVSAWSGGVADHSVDLRVSRVTAEFDAADPHKTTLRPGLFNY